MSVWPFFTGNSNVFRQSYITGFIDVSGITTLRNDVTINGNLTVDASSILQGDVSMNSRLFIGNDVSFSGNLYVSGNLSANYLAGSIPTSAISGSINSNFTTDIISTNRLFVIRDTSLNSRLAIGSDVSFNCGNVGLTSDLSSIYVAMVGNVYLGGNLNAASNMILSNNNVVIQKDVSMNSRFFINNIGCDMSMSGNATVLGNLITNNLSATNNLSVNNITLFAGDVSMIGNIYVSNKTILNGDVSMNARLFVTGNIRTNNSIIANGLTVTSDYRIKDDIVALDSTYVVDELNPVRYYNKLANKEDLGLIAHELQEVYPILVNGEKDGEEYQNVNYIGLLPILINETKLLKKEMNLTLERLEKLEENMN
uniref:Peptidase S74 domain-containing protein n=1 Tax=viral metagenome TaxID=1070528 RepID=A0A6C0JK63_9ZZZZ